MTHDRARPRLPVLGGLFDELARGGGPPSLDEARRALGGPWVAGLDVGACVALTSGGASRVGVVVHGDADERDVMVEPGRVHRVAASRLTPAPSTPALDAIGADARVHASLEVGQRVAYEARDGSVGEGALVEKLRYGALVGDDEGRVHAVGFRRVSPIDPDPAIS